MTYTNEQIHNLLLLLDHLDIKGIENAKRVAVMAEIINSGVKDNDSSKK